MTVMELLEAALFILLVLIEAALFLVLMKRVVNLIVSIFKS